MDVKRAKPKKTKSHLLVGIAAALGLTAVVGLTQVKWSAYSVNSNNLVKAQVQQGAFEIKVSGPGILAPRDIQWVASNVAGKVERLLVKPGASVLQGDLLVVLSNPELKRNVQSLTWQVKAKQAQLTAFKVNQDTQLLDMQARIIQTQMDYEKAKMRYEAEEELIKQGNATVSMLDFETNKLNAKQLHQSLEIEKQRLEQLKRNQKAQLLAEEAGLNELQNVLQQAEFELASLQVTASIDGIVQAVPLELGQRVNVGGNLAKLAQKDDLIAELRIPELNASDVRVGQTVSIDTRFSQIVGEVNRIDPAVVEGSVQVDVTLMSPLPEEARPDLTINGEITISENPQTLFVRRPAFSQQDRQLAIYKLAEDQSLAAKTQVQFGKASSQQIEILDGLKPGDWIIVSDYADYQHHQTISIN